MKLKLLRNAFMHNPMRSVQFIWDFVYFSYFFCKNTFNHMSCDRTICRNAWSSLALNVAVFPITYCKTSRWLDVTLYLHCTIHLTSDKFQCNYIFLPAPSPQKNDWWIYNLGATCSYLDVFTTDYQANWNNHVQNF